jgi:hypothetical protein
LSRYCDYSERTIARQFREPFDWPDFHQRVLMTALDPHAELVSAHDASFLPKSGKQTFGLGHFFNGCASRAERGLELSTLAVVDVTKSAERPRRSRRGWIGVGRAGLNAQEPNKTHAVLEPSMGEGTAGVEAPAFMPGRTSTGRRMLAVLVAGERDPQVLASLALGSLKHKRPQLELALTGQFTAHHGTLLGLLLELIGVLDRQIATLDQEIGALVAPLQAQIAQLDSIPGVDIIAARDILAEIGTDMSRFGDAARLASWAGVCPGNHESAGKRYRGKTRKGNRYLRRILVQCAWGARKTPAFLGRTFRRLEVRIGKKKAALAIAHKILVIVYHLLTLGTSYEEARYDQYNPRQEARERQRALKALERLGYTVTLERAA